MGKSGDDDIKVFIRTSDISNDNKPKYKRGCIAVGQINEAEIEIKRSERLHTILEGTKQRLMPTVNKMADYIRPYAIRLKEKSVAYYDSIPNHMMKTATVIVLVGSAIYITSFFYSIGYEVYVEGKSIGLVADSGQFNKVLKKVNDELVKISGASDINTKPAFILQLVKKDGFSTNNDLEQHVKALSKQMLDSYTIFADDNPIVALSTQEEAQKVLTELKNKYISGNSEIQAEFTNKVEILKQRSPITMFMSVETAVKTITGAKEEGAVYKINEGDTLWGIARTYDMTVDELNAINNNLVDNLQIGQEIRIKKPKPLINVMTTQKAVIEEAIPYKVEKAEDPELYQGKVNVVAQGQEGLKTVEADIVKVNGIEINKNVLAEAIIREPITQTERVGIKPIPRGFGSGNFIRPYYGSITSRFGARWGSRHTGVDLGGNVGDPISCADEGKVTFVGNYYGYGLLVIVNHNNGYETYYGHLSRADVSVGDVVQKGDTIAALGNTGYSTGPHLHFEVRKDGNPVDPMVYLGN